MLKYLWMSDKENVDEGKLLQVTRQCSLDPSILPSSVTLSLARVRRYLVGDKSLPVTFNSEKKKKIVRTNELRIRNYWVLLT